MGGHGGPGWDVPKTAARSLGMPGDWAKPCWPLAMAGNGQHGSIEASMHDAWAVVLPHLGASLTQPWPPMLHLRESSHADLSPISLTHGDQAGAWLLGCLPPGNPPEVLGRRFRRCAVPCSTRKPGAHLKASAPPPPVTPLAHPLCPRIPVGERGTACAPCAPQPTRQPLLTRRSA